jgi:hypothetical protein
MEDKQDIESIENFIIENNLITKEGLKVSGMGILINLIEKMSEKINKIETNLYWLERRDKEREEKKERI